MVDLTICMMDNFSCVLLSADFFNSSFSKKNLSEISSECFVSRSGPTVLSLMSTMTKPYFVISCLAVKHQSLILKLKEFDEQKSTGTQEFRGVYL